MRRGGRHLLARLLFGIAAVLLANAVHADGLTVLWWQVGDWQDETETGESLGDVAVERVNGGGMTNAKDLGVTHARIREVSTGTYLKIMDVDEYGNPLGFTLDAIDVPMRWVADLSDFSSASPEFAFIIELGNYDGSSWSTLALSETASYGDLVAQNNIVTDSDYNPMYATPWMPKSYVVPEPNSGLLVLVGVALVMLKRKRRERAHG